MYLFFGIFFLVLLFFFCLNHWRRKKIIQKVRCMCMKEKCRILDGLIASFGYAYLPAQDIFTSRLDVWQRDFGYCALYDKAAFRFNMVFDCLPVYFEYDGRTWLLELWKGQYGINTGAEIGVYYADRLLDKSEYRTTLFQSVEDHDMPALSFRLFRKGIQIADVCARHWWLTAFSMGRFSWPADLYMQACITFATHSMAHAFIKGLISAGYCRDNIHLSCNTVTFSFTQSSMHWNCLDRIWVRIAQCINHFWCRVYLFVTRPFCLSIDRILYLYFYLPAAFRKMFRIRKYKKHKQKNHGRG